MSLLFNDKSELRAGWKFAVYLLFFTIIWVATGLAITILIAPRAGDLLEDQLALLALNQVALLAPAVIAMWLTVRFVDHRPFRTFGIGFFPGWRRDFLFGLALAAGMLAILIGGCYAFGYVSMHWTGNKAPPGVLIATLVVLLVAAANEELLFRGFPLQLLIDGIGAWPAILAMSMLFGAMHLSNPNASPLGIVNTIVAGILLSLAYVRTRSLWMPYAIHVAWNVGLGFVFGFQLSGIDLASLWTTGTAGSETILGGGYGPEGGLLATFIFGAAAVIVNKHGSINSTKADSGGHPGRDHRDRTGVSG
jgi:membrane protease YdiL (CAAX protease family)